MLSERMDVGREKNLRFEVGREKYVGSFNISVNYRVRGAVMKIIQGFGCAHCDLVPHTPRQHMRFHPSSYKKPVTHEALVSVYTLTSLI